MLLHLHRLITTTANTDQRKQGLEEVTYEQPVSVNSGHIIWIERNSAKVRIGLSDGTIWIIRETPSEIAEMLRA